MVMQDTTDKECSTINIYEVTRLRLNIAGKNSSTGKQGGRVLDRASSPSWLLPVPSFAATKSCFLESRSATNMAAVPVYSITRTEIDEFWRRKEMEAEERRLAAEKEAARIRAKTLKVSPCS